MESEKLLTFELDQDGRQIHIHANKTGLRSLVDILERLLVSGGHDHLMTPAWAGDELTEEKQSNESELLNMVTIHLW
jgi:hypothetical protein